MRNLISFALVGLPLVASVLASSALVAQTADPVLEQGRQSGAIGEQADGYLGIVNPATIAAELKAHVNQVNIKRKAFYTDLATKRNVSVNEVGGATACELFKSRVGANEFYRDETGKWLQRKATEAVKLPAFCPQ